MMRRRVMLSVVCFLTVAAAVSAGEVEWKGGGKDNSWCTADNWEGGKLPSSSDIVVLNPPPERGPVIDCDVICGEIRGPVWKSSEPQVVDVIGCNVSVNGWWRWANRGRGIGMINVNRANVDIKGMFRLSDSGKTYGIANITDSTVKCKGILIGDGGNGEINMNGNVLFEVEDTVDMGGSTGDNPRTYEDKPLRITMNGGVFRIGGELKCPSADDRAGTASIKLTAGTIECKRFSHADVPYSMDIEEGELVIAGDVTGDMKKDVESGYITAYGGKVKVVCTYDSSSKKTVVMSSLHKKAWNSYPANRAEQVLPDVALKWRPGENAQTHVIYIGTTLDAVKPGATAYLKNHESTHFKAPLKFGQTYYWRVDTVDKTGGTASGAIWQFSTSDGKTAEPSPGDKATGVPPDAVLAWKPGLAAVRHKVFLGTDYNLVKNATRPRELRVKGKKGKNTFKPAKLELGKTYYWRVDAVNKKWSESPWKGDVWSFKVDEGKARNPRPVDKGQWVPTKVTLNWEAAKTAASHNVYFGDSPRAMRPVSSGQSQSSYNVGPLKEATTYYWQIEEVCTTGELVKGDIWKFSTEGMLDLKIDLAVPQWYDRSKPRPGTAKEGWVIWASARWADMYMHDGAWLPPGNGTDKDGVLGTGVQFYLDNGKGGNGAVMAKGLCRGGLAGDLPVYGEPEGDPIANTYFYSCDWAGQKNGDAFLLIRGLPAGEYEMTSYHNHWEPCTQQTRNCHLCESGMPPMPSVTANPVPVRALPGYGSWALPKGTGTGVVALESAKDIKVSSVLSDDKVAKSFIRFATDGSDVLIIYEAPDNTYPDRARPGREGARGIFNAFELKKVIKK